VATQLKNIVSLTNVAPGTTTVAHNLNIDGVGAVPEAYQAEQEALEANRKLIADAIANPPEPE
jgi:hypothetical protein